MFEAEYIEFDIFTGVNNIQWTNVFHMFRYVIVNRVKLHLVLLLQPENDGPMNCDVTNLNKCNAMKVLRFVYLYIYILEKVV